MQVFIRFQQFEALEKYLQILKMAGIDKKNYRKSKNNPNLLTVKYENEAEFKELTKEIEDEAVIFGDVEFKSFKVD